MQNPFEIHNYNLKHENNFIKMELMSFHRLQ